MKIVGLSLMAEVDGLNCKLGCGAFGKVRNKIEMCLVKKEDSDCAQLL